MANKKSKLNNAAVIIAMLLSSMVLSLIPFYAESAIYDQRENHEND